MNFQTIIGRISATCALTWAGITLPIVLVLATPALDYWNASLEEARQAASGDGKPILLWIPSASAVARSPLSLKTLMRVSKQFHVARARSSDVTDILRGYGVKRLPGLLLLDQVGGLVARWEGNLPLNLPSRIDLARRRLLKSEEEVARALKQGRALLEQENYPEALAMFRKVRALARENYPEPVVAARLELEILARAGRELKKSLAVEGISPDRELREKLLDLRDRFPHREVSRWIDRELLRIRTGGIAGQER